MKPAPSMVSETPEPAPETYSATLTGHAVEQLCAKPPGTKINGQATFTVGDEGLLTLESFQSPDLAKPGVPEETAEDALDGYRARKHAAPHEDILM